MDRMRRFTISIFINIIVVIVSIFIISNSSPILGRLVPLHLKKSMFDEHTHPVTLLGCWIYLPVILFVTIFKITNKVHKSGRCLQSQSPQEIFLLPRDPFSIARRSFEIFDFFWDTLKRQKCPLTGRNTPSACVCPPVWRSIKWMWDSRVLLYSPNEPHVASRCVKEEYFLTHMIDTKCTQSIFCCWSS